VVFICISQLLLKAHYKTLRLLTSSVVTAMGYGLDGRGFDYRQEQKIFPYPIASRPALGSTQPPIQWAPGALSPEAKRLVHEADLSPPSSAEVKNDWDIPPLLDKSSCCAELIKPWISFTFFSVALPAYSGPRPIVKVRNHFTQKVWLLKRLISPSQGRYLNTGQHKHRINAYTPIPWVGFEPTIPASERAKMVHVLDCAAPVTGQLYCLKQTVNMSA
jgi:hypothetical protein